MMIKKKDTLGRYLLQASVLAALFVTKQQVRAESVLNANCDLVLYASLDKPECLEALGLTSENEVTDETEIPELDLAVALFNDGFNFLHMLSGAVDSVGVEEVTPVRRNLRERDLLTVCKRCHDANNWRRCIKNKCRRRMLKETQLERSFTGRDLMRMADKIREETGVDRRLTVNVTEGEAFALDHDRALLQESINQGVKLNRHPCALEFSIILPDLQAVQAQLALGKNTTYDFNAAKEALKLECSHLKDCTRKYPNLGAYDCKNEEGGVCFCGDNEICGGLLGVGGGGGDGSTTPTNTTDDDTCVRRLLSGECTTTYGCREKYHFASDVYDCHNQRDGVCMCGAGRLCGCKYAKELEEIFLGDQERTCDEKVQDASDANECIERNDCKVYKAIYDGIGVTCGTNNVCYCGLEGEKKNTPCTCWEESI